MGIIGTLPKIKAPNNTNNPTSAVINWSFGPVILKTVTGNATFTFSSVDYSKEITVVVSADPAMTLASVLTFPTTEGAGNVLWPRGNPFCAVGVGESVVVSFKKNGNDIIAYVSNEQVRAIDDDADVDSSSATHVRDFYMEDPSETKYIISKWEKISGSGSGTIGYSDSTTTGMGRGVLTFSGDCTYRLKDFIPIVPDAGIGATCYFQMAGLGSCLLSLGFESYLYDSVSGYIPVTTPASDSTRLFLMNYQSVSTTTPTYKQEICFNESSNTAQNRQDFYTGTRFVKPIIKVSGYVSGLLHLSGFSIYTANFSARGVYTQGDQVIDGIKNFTSQIDLGSSANKISLQFATPAAGRIYTLTDVGANADFVMSEGTQIINGSKTFTSLITGTITNARYSS